MKSGENIQSLKVAATFLGTIIGAGFATGQEIMSFFTVYRFDSFIGIIIATILFVVLGIIIFDIAYIIKRRSYHDFLIYVCGKKFGVIIDVLITIFLFGIFNVMLSASGALFYEYFGLHYYFGIIFTLIPTAIIVVKGIKGILNVNFIIAPITIIVVSSICIASLYNFASGDLIRNLHYEGDITHKWLISMLLFVSYNLVLSTPILVPLGKEINNKKVLIKGITIGALVMGFLILLLNTTILNQIEESLIRQIPMLYIIEPFNDYIQYSFIVVLWLEIFTTAISNLFGLINRLQPIVNTDYKKLVIIVCFISMFISRFDFKTLLSILYPMFGFVCLIFLLFLLIKQSYLRAKLISKTLIIVSKDKSSS